MGAERGDERGRVIGAGESPVLGSEAGRTVRSEDAARAARAEGTSGLASGRVDTVHTDLISHERLLQSVFENLRDGLVVFDRQRRIVFYNRRFLEMTGLDEEQLYKYRLGDIVHPADRPRVREVQERLLAGEIDHATYLFRLVRDRQTFYVEASAAPVRSQSGEIIGIEVLGRDVTERERARQQLEEANRQLREYKRATEADLRMAWRVHRSLLAPPIKNRHIHLAVQYKPYHGIGGDYPHWHVPEPQKLYVTLCDCAGHGIAAALLATRVNSEVRQLVGQSLPPSGVVQALNRFIYTHFSDSGMFVSFIAALFDFESRTLTYSGAGHPPPVLLRGGCSEPELLRSQHLLIGVEANVFVGELETTVPIGPGDRIILYTDGLTETILWPDRPLGVEGLRKIACSHRNKDVFEMGRAIIEELEQISAGPQSDDITLMVAELQ